MAEDSEFATTTKVTLEVRLFPTIPRGVNNEVTDALIDGLSNAVDETLEKVLGQRQIVASTETRIVIIDVISESTKEIDL